MPTPRDTWSPSAAEAFTAIVDAHEPDGARLSALYCACDLLSAADDMQAQIDSDGLTVDGSMGQQVAHPLVAEVRQYRKTALDTLRQLGLSGQSASSAAASALANKRWSGRKAPVTPIRTAS